MDRKLIFITGGCRSGKSRFALDYANQHFSKKLYLATCEVLDEEMARRVEIHKEMRGKEWLTIEEPIEVVQKVVEYGNEVEVILIDCITLWISNLLIKWKSDERIMAEVEKLTQTFKKNSSSFIIVSNEVGMGIVPAEPLSRRFRDLAGWTNQKISHSVDKVVFMVSGIPIFLKGDK